MRGARRPFRFYAVIFRKTQIFIEGITLSLLRNHNMREIEVILSYLLEDDDAIEECLDRLKGFTRALF